MVWPCGSNLRTWFGVMGIKECWGECPRMTSGIRTNLWRLRMAGTWKLVMETKAKPQAKSNPKKERRERQQKPRWFAWKTQATKGPMLHVDIIAMIPKEVDLLQWMKRKWIPFLRLPRGFFFWLNKAKPKFPFKGQRKFLAKKKVEKAKNKRL